MFRAAFLLLATGLILGYATLHYGAVLTADWNRCALVLGVVVAVGYLPLGRDGVSAPVNRLLYLALLAIPLWAVLQTVPLPQSWIHVLSPARAALAARLLRFDPRPMWVPLSIRPEATLQYALRYLAYCALFLIARDLMWRMPGRQWLIAIPPMVIAALEAVVGILQNQSRSATASVTGTFVNRDHFSAMLEMCLPFAAGAVFGFAPRGIKAVGACAGAAVAALYFAAIVLSLSRGGFFIAFVSLLLLIWLHANTGMRRGSRLVVVLVSSVALVCAAIALASGGLLDRMATPAGGDLPFNDRFHFWRETAHVIAAYPLFGCGFGGFVSAVAPYREFSVTRTLDYAHNDYLQFLAEGGIVPFTLALIAASLVAQAVWRGIFRQPSPRRRGFAIACGVALFAGAVHSEFDLITYVPATAMLLCWIAGMCAGLEFDQPPAH